MIFNIHWPTVGASVAVLLLVLLLFYIGTKNGQKSNNGYRPSTGVSFPGGANYNTP